MPRAGDDDRYEGASDDELAGAIAAWDRAEAHACARKHAAVAEFIRRRPGAGCALEGPAQVPGTWEEFAADELRLVLAGHRGAAEAMLGVAQDLAARLPGTAAAFRDGTWTLSTGIPGQPDLIVTLDPITTENCDHRYESQRHDPGVRLRHLAQVRHATCTGPGCRRPAAACDFEHNVPYEAGGRTCLCNTGPKCRHDHRLKQHPKWTVDQLPDSTFRWTTPSGRRYTTEPTRYPI